MPHSGTGRSKWCTENHHSSTSSPVRIPATKRLIGGFRKSGLHHPGAGCAIARPSSAEDGTKNVHSPDSRESRL